MRAVSHTWQQGFELATSSIAINNFAWYPVLPSPRRFPDLTRLNLGNRSVRPATLRSLRAFTKLNSLILGDKIVCAVTYTLTRCLTDAELKHLQVKSEGFNP